MAVYGVIISNKRHKAVLLAQGDQNLASAPNLNQLKRTLAQQNAPYIDCQTHQLRAVSTRKVGDHTYNLLEARADNIPESRHWHYHDQLPDTQDEHMQIIHQMISEHFS